MSTSNYSATAMLIDDNDVVLALHRRVIKRSGCGTELLIFDCAEDALLWLRRPERQAINLILLDVNMPRMNGFEFLDQALMEFGEHFVKGSVVMLSTSLDPRDTTRAATYPIVSKYFGKPLTVDLWRDILQYQFR